MRILEATAEEEMSPEIFHHAGKDLPSTPSGSPSHGSHYSAGLSPNSASNPASPSNASLAPSPTRDSTASNQNIQRRTRKSTSPAVSDGRLVLNEDNSDDVSTYRQLASLYEIADSLASSGGDQRADDSARSTSDTTERTSFSGGASSKLTNRSSPLSTPEAAMASFKSELSTTAIQMVLSNSVVQPYRVLDGAYIDVQHPEHNVGRPPLSLDPCERVVIAPLYHDRHWVLAVWDMNQRKISYFNSLTGYGSIDRKIMQMTVDVGKSLDGADDWCVEAKPCPQQTNGVDCGVYASVLALHLMAGIPIPIEVPVQAWRFVFAMLIDANSPHTMEFGYTVPPPHALRSGQLRQQQAVLSLLCDYQEICAVLTALLGKQKLEETALDDELNEYTNQRDGIAEVEAILQKRSLTQTLHQLDTTVHETKEQLDEQIRKIQRRQRSFLPRIENLKTVRLKITEEAARLEIMIRDGANARVSLLNMAKQSLMDDDMFR
ncbi:MAG: hypothetical protein Q9166_000001 [cf. Caloplaca sp. 2 TL-2023]